MLLHMHQENKMSQQSQLGSSENLTLLYGISWEPLVSHKVNYEGLLASIKVILKPIKIHLRLLNAKRPLTNANEP